MEQEQSVTLVAEAEAGVLNKITGSLGAKMTAEELELAVQKLCDDNELAAVVVIKKSDGNLRYRWIRCEVGAALDMMALVRKAMVAELSK